MAANSKRAKLGPQIMGGSAAPAGSLRTMAIARRNPHGAAAEPPDNEGTAAAPAEAPVPAADELFYKKGAATAATFRPNYWTYESNRAAVEASEGLEGSGPSEEELSASDTAGLALVVRPSQPPAIPSEVAPAAETREPDFAEPAPKAAVAADIETPLAAETEAPAIFSEVAPVVAELPEPDFAEPAPELAATTALDEASLIEADIETPLAAAEAPEPDFAETTPEPTATTALDEPSSDIADIETPPAFEAEALAILPEVPPAPAEASEPDFAELALESAVTAVLDEASSEAANIDTPLVVEAEAPAIFSEVAPVAETPEPDLAEPAPEATATTALDEASFDTADIETPLTVETEAPSIPPEVAPMATEAFEPDFAEPAPGPDVAAGLDEPSSDAANIDTPLAAEAEALAALTEVAPAAAEAPELDFAEPTPESAVTAVLDEPSSEATNIETPQAVEAEVPAVLSEVMPVAAEGNEPDFVEAAPEPALITALDELLPATVSETTTPAVDEAPGAAFDLAVPEAPEAVARFDAAPEIDVSEPPASDGAAALFDAPAASETAPPSQSVALDETPRSDGNDLLQTLHAAVAAPFEPTTSMSFEDRPTIDPETVMAPDAVLWEAVDAGVAPAEIEPPTTGFIAPALAAEAPPAVAIEEAEPLAAEPIAPPSEFGQVSLACETHPAAESDIARAVGEASEAIAPTEAAPIIAAPSPDVADLPPARQPDARQEPPPARKEKRPDPRLAAERAAQDAGAVELAAMIESVLIDKSYQKTARSAAMTPLSTAMRMSGRPKPRALWPRSAPTPAAPPKPLAQAATVAAIASVAPKRRAPNRLLVLVCLGVILPATFYATALRHGDTENSASLAVAAPAAPLSEDLMPETVSAFNETTQPFPAAPIRPSHKPHHPAAKHPPVR